MLSVEISFLLSLFFFSEIFIYQSEGASENKHTHKQEEGQRERDKQIPRQARGLIPGRQDHDLS